MSFSILKKGIIPFLFLITLPCLGLAQTYTTEKTASGKSLKLFEKAESQSRDKDFEAALKTLDKLLETDPVFVNAYLIRAAIYYDQMNFEAAEADFAKALQLAPDYKPRAWYQSGLNKMRQDKFEAAIPDFEQFLKLETRSEKMLDRAKKHLANCKFAAQAIKNPVPFHPKSIGENINTPGFEYLPSITADGEFLVYTTRINNQEDLYYSKKVNGLWQPGNALEAINTPMNEATQTLAADGRLLIYTACNRKDGLGSCDLYYSEFKKGNWTHPANLGAPLNTKAWDSQPSVSANGDVLYFASERGGGKGGKDLWMSYRTKNGDWTKPENLGDKINTDGNEQAPFIHPDGQTLYFMSDGHPGMGDYDLFFSRKDEAGNWSTPQNLGYPINTKAHEGALFVSLDGKTAYFASDKDYSLTADQPVQRKTTDIYYFDLYPDARPAPVTYVKAIVRDHNTGKALVEANAEIIDLETGNSLLGKETDPDGSFLITLPSGKNYALNVSREKYLFHSENFELTDRHSISKPFLLEIELAPIPEAAEPPSATPVVLRNVFFETGSAALLPASRVELDRLKLLLEENPGLKIQINGHTDEVGDAQDNQVLSENRAKAVRDYLIAQGISPERLSFAGFGETMPVDSNDTEEGRRNNRRTEFIIVQ